MKKAFKFEKISQSFEAKFCLNTLISTYLIFLVSFVKNIFFNKSSDTYLSFNDDDSNEKKVLSDFRLTKTYFKIKKKFT